MVDGARVLSEDTAVPWFTFTRTTRVDVTTLEFIASRFHWLPFQRLLQLLVAYCFLRFDFRSLGLLALGLLCAHYAQFPAKPGIQLPRSRHFDVLVGTPRVVNNDNYFSNCNMSIAEFDGRYFCAIRQAETHFASPTARLTIYATQKGVSPGAAASTAEWKPVWTFHSGKDLREPLFFVLGGKLFFYFFEGVPQPLGFGCFRTVVTSFDGKVWEEPKEVAKKGEIVWEIKVREGRAYKASYVGEHYNVAQNFIGVAEESAERLQGVQVLFEVSDDGLKWSPVGESSVVYVGGVCEVAFEWDEQDNLVAVGRNEDGDRTGFGTQVFFAPKGSWGKWKALPSSMKVRYDSPRLFRCGKEVLMAARYTPYSYDLAPSALPFQLRLVWNLLTHSHRPKSCAIYRIAVDAKKQELGIEVLRKLPESCGDTGFPSVWPCPEDASCPPGASSYLIANYTSRDAHSHTNWLFGQLNETDVWIARMILEPAWETR